MLPFAFELNSFSLFLGILATVGWITGTLTSVDYLRGGHDRGMFYVFWSMTFFAVLGVFFAADFLTAFVFFEIMSFTSYVLVIYEQSPQAIRASDTYLAIAVIGGMATLLGLLLLQHLTGTLRFSALPDACRAVADKDALYGAGALIFVGFAVKAGAVPVHVWLPTAHPAAPAPASAVLSGVLTKCGIIGIVLVTTIIFAETPAWGWFLLAVSCATMLLGAVLAIFSDNLKRTFACSSVSQIGFVLSGIAMLCLLGPEHNALAAQGISLHILNHATIKIILFPCAGIIHLTAHSYELNKLRGFGRGKPALALIMGIPMFSLAGLPLLSGYASKTLLHEAIVEFSAEAGIYAGWVTAAEWVFLISGGLTLGYMLKVFLCIFVEKNPGKTWEKGPYMRPTSWIPVAACTAALLVLGLAPGLLMEPLSVAIGHGLTHAHLHTGIHFFALENLKGSVLSIALGVVAYFVLVRGLMKRGGEYVQRWPAKVNLEDRIYRPLLLQILPAIGMCLARGLDTLTALGQYLLRTLIFAGGKRTVCPPEDAHFSLYHRSRARQVAQRTTLAYSMAWACFGLVLLCAYLLVTYFVL
ncbi:MAG: proton-conducting transporter membrane subunit [Oscillospiraceae bacterium]|nr:proton-conducting transporter membrane subunit [Oscillospiraceae bacterium]